MSLCGPGKGDHQLEVWSPQSPDTSHLPAPSTLWSSPDHPVAPSPGHHAALPILSALSHCPQPSLATLGPRIFLGLTNHPLHTLAPPSPFLTQKLQGDPRGSTAREPTQLGGTLSPFPLIPGYPGLHLSPSRGSPRMASLAPHSQQPDASPSHLWPPL